ncbi:MAG: hypothetical protein JNM22_15545 [Saprospiraceae bacterium]|nr:hypothetical protein [Saprospiraceae bacterium]
MTRILLLMLVALTCAGTLKAQDEMPEKKRLMISNELGVNFTNILNKIIKINRDSANENPYLLTYRLGLNRKWGIRTGVGGSNRYIETREEGFADSETERTTALDARLGFDYRIELGRRFEGSFGLDAVGKWRNHKQVSDSGFDVIQRIEQSEGYGGGPFVGLHFWITPNLALYTEASFYMLYSKRDTARIFKNFPELNDQIFRETNEDLVTTLPSSIFVIYRF